MPIRKLLVTSAIGLGAWMAMPSVQAIPVDQGFDERASMHGISFRVRCPNTSGVNSVEIIPSGLLVDNTVIIDRVDGRVIRIEVADLDVDQSPEIYIYIRPSEESSRTRLLAYASNRRKSLSSIYLPDLDPAQLSKISLGIHDEMAVVENRLVRRFPIDGKKMRQIQYRLDKGESGWRLQVDRVIEF